MALMAYQWVNSDLDLSSTLASAGRVWRDRGHTPKRRGDRFVVWEPPTSPLPVKAAARPAPLASSLRP
jgi:hypothetical protein